MPLAEAEISRAAREAWVTILGRELHPMKSCRVIPSTEYHGSVRISGSWECELSLELSGTLARDAAAWWLGLAPGMATEEDIRDSLGELANVVGGNLKSLLPGENRISLPSVTTGAASHSDPPTPGTLARLAFECDGRFVIVSLVRPEA